MQHLSGNEACKYLIAKTLSGDIDWNVKIDKRLQFVDAETKVQEGRKKVRILMDDKRLLIGPSTHYERVSGNLLIDLWKIVKLMTVKKMERQVIR